MTGTHANWAWVGPDAKVTTEEWRQRLAQWREAGVEAILPEVFNGHSALYASQHLPVADQWLERLLPIAQAEGMAVHAWIHTMQCATPATCEEHPEWYNVSAKGMSSATDPSYVSYYRFLCPSRPEVHDFLQQRVTELAQYGDLAGIHLDYIRHPDVILAESLQPKYGIVQDREYPEYDYCYCSACRQGFAQQTGIDPLELEDPSLNGEWRQFRCDLITSIVNDKLVPIGRGAGKAMTAATFPNWEHVRQEWSAWDLDAVLPMLYHNFYNAGIGWIGDEVRRGIASLKRDFPLYSGLFVPALQPGELVEAIDVSLEGGAAGVSLFTAGAMSEEHWQRFSEAIRR